MAIKRSFWVLLLFMGCVGTDYVDDPIVDERIEVSQEKIALKKDQAVSLSAVFFDKYGVEKPVTFTWITSNPQVVTVDQNGLVKAIGPGQAMVVVSSGSNSASIDITVVSDDSQVAFVELSSPNLQHALNVNENLQLSVTVKNIKNEILTGKLVEWFSENSLIASVNSAGLLTGVSSGIVDIHAKSEGVKSNVLSFTVGGGRSGSFISAGGYKAVGMAMITLKNGNLILDISSNFETSFALGTYVYLANVTNGAQVKAGGLEVAQITDNGAKTFNLSALKPGIGLYEYNYVIILCKPASVTFGYAELK